MKTLDTANVPSDQLDDLERYAASIAPELGDFLRELLGPMRSGDEIIISDDSATLTPNQAAERLGMSRTHIYKLLDRGQIAFDRVGRDRRIPINELIKFEEQRQHDRRELAERFAHQNQTTASATDELADLL
ncbi:helix-turn-helix domain-containing protein [Propionimicrobium sp. PCR01-08-3]|uniref:helix-turn-helix domain-containing protein n=1 Tax=Propionimicrobium sp. PCR01-08-3 TaxID=3052086 RepID=UPI00255CB262|nr:helix-turn-helix domain-containing protein [Propionimicrobium sp. PCR01-08-3]WIY83001.1 helix-turn-helix domain-containing protein [Propionimicrobium sp. PCR01-08-3]